MAAPWLSKLIAFARPESRGDERKPVIADVLLLASGDSASIDYFIAPYVAALGQTVARIDVGGDPPSDVLRSECHTIVIVRYLPKRWLGALRELKRAGKRIVYFMDDDLMDPAAAAGLPSAYVKKIRSLAFDRRADLESMCSEFWVASPFLAEKYRAWKPVILAPQPATSVLEQARVTSVCYHGTASHQAEMKWLVPVVDALHATVADVNFEIFGDHSVNRMFRNLPRVSIVHPMTWPNYLAFTAAVRRDIALAPLLPGPFNAGRCPTKFFDFSRLGAVGIYADAAPYRGFIRDGIDGVLLPNDADLWVQTIVELAADAPRRERMAKAARQRALALAWDGPLAANQA